MTTGTARRRWPRFGPVAAAGLLAASACGPAVAHPHASAQPVVRPTATVRPSAALPRPIPGATLQAALGGSSARVIPLTFTQAMRAMPDLAHSEAAAIRTALAQQPRGSKVLEMTLARVQGPPPGFHQPRLTWLVSVDPFGGAYGSGGPACGREDFVIEFVDPVTGNWLMAMAGAAPGLRPLPLLGPKPRLMPGTPCRGGGVRVPGGASG